MTVFNLNLNEARLDVNTANKKALAGGRTTTLTTFSSRDRQLWPMTLIFELDQAVSV